MPVHGTLSRKLQKGVRLQINEDRIYESATLFLSEKFVRLTETVNGENINTDFALPKIDAIRTYSTQD